MLPNESIIVQSVQSSSARLSAPVGYGTRQTSRDRAPGQGDIPGRTYGRPGVYTPFTRYNRLSNRLSASMAHGRRSGAPDSSHHIETTDAGLDGLCIREISVYHTNLSLRLASARSARRLPAASLCDATVVIKRIARF